MKSFTHHALLVSLFLLFAASAQATPLTLENCGSCDGSDVSLDISTSDGGLTYDVTLTIDVTGATTNYSGDKDGIVQAGFKAFDGITAGDVTLVSAPNGSWDPAVLSTVSASSFCGGGADADFVCTTGFSSFSDPGNDAGDPGKYVFKFVVDGTNATLLSEWTIKFQYCDADDFQGGDCNGGLISEPGTPGTPGTPVPEPSAALVLAVGMLAAAPKLRRRR